MNDEIKNLILAGKFKEAYDKILSYNLNEVSDFLIISAFNPVSITFYGFVNYLISLNESATLHDLAADILAYPLCYLEGAYQTALFHARRAVELDPENLEYLQFLLFFHDIPDKLIQKEEALEIAQAVLRRDPKSQIAKEVLEKYAIK